MNTERQNWAGNYTYAARALRKPQSVGEVQAAVTDTTQSRALGTRHSFNTIADTAGEQISLEKLDHIVGIDAVEMTVTVGAGITYAQLGTYLHRRGYGLHNLASLPHISVAGACATATHGSGDNNGNLATAVVAMKLVTAQGDIINLSRQDQGDAFDGSVVGLGALGVVTELTLKIVPTFLIRQFVYDNLPFASLETHFDQIVSSAYSVSLFTDWHSDRVSQIWQKCLITGVDQDTPPRTFFNATLAEVDRHPITSLSAENCTPQCGVPGPWPDRLPHFRMEHTPSSGKELQSEYFIPRQHAVAALRAIVNLRARVTPHLLISEIRTIAADSLWMSPCYQQACVGIHFTWKQDWSAVQRLLPLIEDALAAFDARPHWAKLFAMSPGRIAGLYPKLPEFQKLVTRFDPRGKFRNAFVDQYILTCS